jgi:hypothetical protein
MGKKSFFILISFFVPIFAFTQVKKPWNISRFDDKIIHFGFSIGVNSMDFGIKRTMDAYTTPTDTFVFIPDVSSIMPPGFQVQIISDLRLSDNLNLRFLPGISFGQRALSFYLASDPAQNLTVDISSAYLDFPLDLKYRAVRLNNYRPYLLGGLNFRYDMSSRNDEEVIIQTKPADLYVEGGIGVDWYLPFFKFSTEIKAGIGLRDVLVHETNDRPQYLNSLEALRSYIFCLSFHFE